MLTLIRHVQAFQPSSINSHGPATPLTPIGQQQLQKLRHAFRDKDLTLESSTMPYCLLTAESITSRVTSNVQLDEVSQDESEPQRITRALGILNYFTTANRSRRDFIAVSHDTFIRYLVGLIIGRNASELEPLNHCSVTVLNLVTPSIEVYNSTVHLPGRLRTILNA